MGLSNLRLYMLGTAVLASKSTSRHRRVSRREEAKLHANLHGLIQIDEATERNRMETNKQYTH